MNRDAARDLRSGLRQNGDRRRGCRRRLRPTVVALEGRTLLSTFQVTSTLDDGSAGTLRYEIAQANSDSGPDAITFSSLFDTPQTIALTGGPLDLTDTATTTITGPGAGLLTISGSDRKERGLVIAGGASALLSGLTIAQNYFGAIGAGVNNAGSLTLMDVTISGNTTIVPVGGGGGIFNSGTAMLIGVTVSDNTALRGDGAGLFNTGTMTLIDSTVSGNQAKSGVGGGLYDVGGALTVMDSTFSSNRGYFGGGGLFCAGPTVSLTNVTVSGNSTNTSNKIDDGGGVFFDSCTGTLTNCTISGNSAGSGGGVYLRFSNAALTNCTISGNSAIGVGGGVYASGLNAPATTYQPTLTNCTISGNSAPTGGGVDNYNATPALTNTIVAGNTNGSGAASDVGGAHAGGVTGSYNLIGTGGADGLLAADHNQIGVADPDLAPVGDYGGPTETMALLPGSPAIGAGTTVSGVTTDQRGLALDSPPDIGAFQTGPLVVNTTVDAVVGAPFGDLSLRQAVHLANALTTADTTPRSAPCSTRRRPSA